MSLRGAPFDLHLGRPADARPENASLLVVYGSGDGGWFGAAVDMFRAIEGAGYFVAGFSSRSLLKRERAHGAPFSTAELAEEYRQIIDRARTSLGLPPGTRVILTGWSRGAAFAVLAASEKALAQDTAGVVAIGLAEGEDLKIGDADDDSDDGAEDRDRPREWRFAPYARVAQLGSRPCAVIQATNDRYLPAERARVLFGADTELRRFYAIAARNHRFSGGRAAFDVALREALLWVNHTSSTAVGSAS
jgi:pimeloyl-ACP methyl ester carboxylesterase